MNKYRKGSVSFGLVFLIAALAFAGGALLALLSRPAQVAIGGSAGPEHTERQYFRDGIVVSSSTNADRITTFDCNTALFTLGALQERGAATTSAWVASTSITVSGAATNGVAFVAFATTSVPNVAVHGKVQSANTVTTYFENLGATNLGARTSSATVTACVLNNN